MVEGSAPPAVRTRRVKKLFSFGKGGERQGQDGGLHVAVIHRYDEFARVGRC